MYRMPFTLIAALAVAASAPAFADDQPAASEPAVAAVSPKAGQTIRDADGRRIGVVDNVRDDKVVVITPIKIVRIPVSTVSMDASGLKTSLKRSELR